jgi:hypothetical protein
VHVKSADFASHVADDHDILERFEIKSLLESLRIDPNTGKKSCPLQCGYCSYSSCKGELDLHLRTHDLSERVAFSSSIKLIGLSLGFGRAKCPICQDEICDASGWVCELCRHITDWHTYVEWQSHGRELVRLLGQFSGSYALDSLGPLSVFISDFIKAELDSATTQPSIARSSYGGSFRKASGPLTDLNVELLAATTATLARAEVSPVGVVAAQHECALQSATPQHNSTHPQTNLVMENWTNQQSFLLSQPLMTQESFISQQNPVSQQGSVHGFVPQQSSMPPLHLMPHPTYVTTFHFLTPGSVQNAGNMPLSVPTAEFQDNNIWQPLQNGLSNSAYNQYHPTGHFQWSLQPDMTGYGNGNQQQDMASFVPLIENMPGDMGFWPEMQYEESDGENNQ